MTIRLPNRTVSDTKSGWATWSTEVVDALRGLVVSVGTGGGGGGGTTTNAVTFNNGGAGAASGATFDGSAAKTISYNTVGAQVAGSYQPLSANLTAYAGANWAAGVQIPALTAANTITLKTVGSSAGNILDKTAGDALYQPLDSDLTALAGNSTDGFWAHTAAGTGAARTLTAPAAGLTITNPAGIAGNPTFALANDLAALEALSGTNTLYYRSAADTWTAVTIGSGLSFSAGTLNKATFRGALVTKAADQTAANYTGTANIAWDSEAYDTDSIHDNVTNNTRLTVPSGVTKVRLIAQVNCLLVTTGVIEVIAIMKNGSASYTGYASDRSDISNTDPAIGTETPVLSVTAGDYFEVALTITSDTSVTIQSGRSWFAMEIIE